MIPIEIIRKFQQTILETENTATPFPLIECHVGEVTSEQCLTHEFYRKIYMATAGRYYYVDKFHELCLCVHYNFRIPGEYRFDPVYRYYITKKRMCNTVHHDMGNVACPEMIIKEFSDINNTKGYGLYNEFLSLKGEIENRLRCRKPNSYDPFEYGLTVHFDYKPVSENDLNYTVYETPFAKKKEMVQFYFNNKTKQWETMSVSKGELSDLMTFFKDFDFIDKNELHLRRFMSIYENAVCKGSEYHDILMLCDNYNNQRIKGDCI